jgi:plastocyanin
LSSTNARWLAAAAVTAAAYAAIGCGSSSTEPTKVSMSISEQGQAATLKAPKSFKGGLVEIDFKNDGKAPHGVQLLQYKGDHTSDDALKQLGSNSNKIPEWLRALGGTSAVPGGQSDTATVNLPEGNYVVVDSAALGGGPGGPPATADVKVTSGDTGDLPSTDATVKAAKTGKDKYAWQVSGLKAGTNQITFDSEGSDAVHFIIAAPVKGKAPPLSKIKSDFAQQNGPPPPYLDVQNAQSTAVLDGGQSQTTTLELKKPGQYVFFCPLTDRDGGKSHDQEGLLSVETVK